MPELLATLTAARKRTEGEREFLAAIQGIDLNEGKEERDFEEVRRRAHIRAAGGNPDANDIKDLSGALAEREGFGIGQGLGYEVD